MSVTLLLVFVLMLAAWLISMLRYAQLNTAQRYLSVYFGTVMITEFFATVSGRALGDNLYIYNIANFLQLPMLCLYFNYSIQSLRKRRIGIWLAGLEVVLFALNLIYLEPITIFNKNPLLLHSVLMVFMGLSYLLELMGKEQTRRTQDIPGFWISIILTFYWLTAFVNYSLYNYFEVRGSVFSKYWGPVVESILIITYVAFILVFLLLPRMKRAAGSPEKPELSDVPQ